MTAHPLVPRLFLLLPLLLLSACDQGSSTSSSSPTTSASSKPAKITALRFSAIPDQNSTELKEKFEAMAKHLAQKLGVPVECVPATDYKASVEMFKNGDIQLA